MIMRQPHEKLGPNCTLTREHTKMSTRLTNRFLNKKNKKMMRQLTYSIAIIPATLREDKILMISSSVQRLAMKDVVDEFAMLQTGKR